MITLTTFVNLYRFKADRVIYTLSEIERELAAVGGDGLAQLLDELQRGAEVARSVRELEIRWKGSRGARIHGAEAKLVDADMDRALTALDSFLGSALQAWGAESPQGKAAARAREGLFPHGVVHMIRLPYMREQVQVAELLERADGDPKVSAALRELKGGDFVERVREVHARYVEVLRNDHAPRFEQIEEARRACHERFCAIVCLVAGRWGSADPESAEGQALARALEEVLRQNRTLRHWYRRRRRVPEVDPETGEEHVVFDDELTPELEDDPGPVEAAEDVEAPSAAEASPRVDPAAEGANAPPVADPPALPNFDAKSEGAA